MQLTGTDMIHVPYKGTAPALVDLMGGQVDVFFDNISSSPTFHQARQDRASWRSPTSKRSPQLPRGADVRRGRAARHGRRNFLRHGGAARHPEARSSTTRKRPSRRAGPARREAEVRRTGRQAARLDARADRASSSAAESDKWGKVIKAANVTVE